MVYTFSILGILCLHLCLSSIKEDAFCFYICVHDSFQIHFSVWFGIKLRFIFLHEEISLFKHRVVERRSFPHYVTLAAWLKVVPMCGERSVSRPWSTLISRPHSASCSFHLCLIPGLCWSCPEASTQETPAGVAPGRVPMPRAPAFADFKFPTSLLGTKSLLLHLFRCCVHATLELWVHTLASRLPAPLQRLTPKALWGREQKCQSARLFMGPSSESLLRPWKELHNGNHFAASSTGIYLNNHFI